MPAVLSATMMQQQCHNPIFSGAGDSCRLSLHGVARVEGAQLDPADLHGSLDLECNLSPRQVECDILVK